MVGDLADHAGSSGSAAHGRPARTGRSRPAAGARRRGPTPAGGAAVSISETSPSAGATTRPGVAGRDPDRCPEEGSATPSVATAPTRVNPRAGLGSPTDRRTVRPASVPSEGGADDRQAAAVDRRHRFADQGQDVNRTSTCVVGHGGRRGPSGALTEWSNLPRHRSVPRRLGALTIVAGGLPALDRRAVPRGAGDAAVDPLGAELGSSVAATFLPWLIPCRTRTAVVRSAPGSRTSGS